MIFQNLRRIVVSVLFVFSLIYSPVSHAFEFPPPPEIPTGAGQKGDFVEDELLVKFKEDINDDKKDKIHEKHGSTKIKEFEEIRVHLVPFGGILGGLQQFQ